MKYLLVVPDGLADRPSPQLDGRTVLQVAEAPNMHRLAQHGRVGVARTIPEGMSPGSDVAMMSILGHDPRRYYTGRGPLEAAGRGVGLEEDDVVYRCNLIATDGERLLDYAAGHIGSEEAAALMELVNEKLGSSRRRFIPGVSYRHLLVWSNGPVEVRCTPPHDVVGEALEEQMPEGEREGELRQMLWDSYELLDRHPINLRRKEAEQQPANMIWPWGQGKTPVLPSFPMRWGVQGVAITAVDLVRGLARLIDLEVVEVAGATGYLDTNYEGKARAAVHALAERDFVMVHVEATDEAGHSGKAELKVKAAEEFDRRMLGVLLDGLGAVGEYRLLVLPDHATPLEVRTHVGDPVPFVLYESGGRSGGGAEGFTEDICASQGVPHVEGHELMGVLMRS